MSDITLDPLREAVRPVPPAPPPPRRPTADPREANATVDLWRYGLILAQLGLILVVFRQFRLEERAFLWLSGLMFGGFAVQYWLPFAWRQTFCIGLSLAGVFVLIEPVPASLLLGAGLLFFGILASPLSYRARVAILLGLAALLTYARATDALEVPYQFWPVLGAIFMFRMMIYLYDLRFAKHRPSLKDYLSYFYLLPNYYFLLFPVVDFQTMRKSYYRRDIHDVVQQGIDWIVRGAIQLMLYRLVYHLKGPSHAPEAITSLPGLAMAMVTTYLLYLRVSGQFHIIVGLLHLFGYDLPETHRKYLLAHSLTDFWRRINIYWKDFMVKMVYFPVYFRFRRTGEVRAQLVATALVFLTTWVLHSYQWFWLRGEVLVTWTDALFWAILGGLVMVNVLVEQRRKGRRVTDTWRARLRLAAQVAGTFCLITTLWYLWNAPSLSEWWELMTWWTVG